MAKLPAPGTDPYNYPGHGGIDVCRGSNWSGKPFYASGPGKVLRLSKNALGGNWIVIKYDAIPDEIGYAHMNNHNGCPKPGTRVGLGTRLGYVGSLGQRVTGPHVHMENLRTHKPQSILDAFDFTRQAKPGGIVRHITVNRSVKAVQQAVGVTADGIWGPKTEAAVKAFQKKHGLGVDGIWGPKSDAAAFKPAGNADTKRVQSNLNLIGYKLAVDGIKGPATTSSIKDFQKRNGLAVDGIWGPKSQAKFEDILSRKRPILRYSSRGKDVKVLQRKLGVNVDGIFGPATQSAVKAFQKKHGLTEDGIVGFRTWRKLGV